jgi:hypothetical protein
VNVIAHEINGHHFAPMVRTDDSRRWVCMSCLTVAQVSGLVADDGIVDAIARATTGAGTNDRGAR